MAKKTDKQLRIGIIGAGGMGKTHLQAYAMNKIKVVAVADTNLENAEKFGDEAKCKVYLDYREMIKSEKLDAVNICTPPTLHKDIAVYAFNQKVSVFCEKPLAISVKEAKAMVEAAKKNKCFFGTGYCHRFQWQVIQAKQWIKEGKLGEIVSYQNRFGGMFTGVENLWFSNKKISGGGMILDTLTHSLDLFRYLVGDVVNVKAQLATFNPKLKVEDTAILLLQTKSGSIGSLEGSWYTPYTGNIINIYGSKGSVFINYNDNSLNIVSPA